MSWSWLIPVGIVLCLVAIAWNERKLRQKAGEDEPPSEDV